MRPFTLAPVLLVLLLTGCVSGGASSASSYSRDEITRDEIEGFPATSAFDAVSRLRPTWLRGRSGSFQSETGRNYPEVFVDGRHFGTLESLNQIGVEAIATIRLLSAADATTRYGTGYPAGIIEVITRRG